ncbi:ATP-binding cassette domain-containing protein [Candidatus Foliamicus sp.]
MIELKGISRSFEGKADVRVDALRDVSLEIGEGEFVCVIGSSGAGKSTLMNILGCLDRPSDGSYLLAGREVQSISANRLAWLRGRIFGFVFQSYNLLESATVRENVELPGLYAGVSLSDRKERSNTLLAQLELTACANHLPSELSGGEQQRVAIARALMNGGSVILADEPTGALDRENGEQVIRIFEGLVSAGRTVVIITHNPEIAIRAGRVIELRDGCVARDSGPAPDKTAMLEEGTSTARRGPSRLSRVLGTVRESWCALRTNITRGAGLRTALTILAISMAVTSGVVVLSIGEGIYRETVKSTNSMGLDTIRVAPEDWLPTLVGHPDADWGVARDFQPLTLEDAWAIRDQVANVRAVSPSILLMPIPVRQGESAGTVGVKGYVDLGRKPGRGETGYRLEVGEHITKLDDDNLERVVVLEAGVREMLFPLGANPIGQQILIQDIPFRVKGVYEPRRSPGRILPDTNVHIPFKTASALLTGRKEIDDIYVFVGKSDHLLETVGAIRDIGIRRRGSDTLVFDHLGFSITGAKKFRARLWLMLGTIATCALMAGSLSVMNIMLASIQARRREIGIRMAVGARRKDILSQFFGESTLLSVAGTTLGALVALVSMPILPRVGVAVEPSLPFFVLPVVSALVVGALFGIVPARRAACLNPVSALAAH